MANKKSIKPSVQKIVAQKSGNLCAFEDCRVSLTLERGKAKESTIGELAHIYGENRGSARYVEDMSEDERRSTDNLIYLCPTCHSKIDKQKENYPAEYLIELKFKHEEWVKTSLRKAMTSVTFIELENVVSHVLSAAASTDIDFYLITIEQKIKKNKFSSDINNAIKMGLAKSIEVEKYISSKSTIESIFADRLKTGLLAKYNSLKRNGYDGDNLFYELQRYAAGDNADFKRQAASIAVLAYFFEKCEIFEK